MSKKGLFEYIALSKKHKPDATCPDYIIENNLLIGWIFTAPQRSKPASGKYFKRGCWYYPMGLIFEFGRVQKLKGVLP